MKHLIVAEQIVKSYGEQERRLVLDHVSLTVGEGEFVAVMGPSGSGKSTLMFALSGMDRPDDGTVAFDGADLTKAGERELADLRRTKMGFVFQQPTMLRNLSILDNIILPAMRDNRKHAAALTQRARALMQRTGIADLEKRGITQVSGGQLQRAGICRALMNSPKIIFGDEPTGALNSQSAQEIMDLLSDANEDGTAVMLVTHDAKVAARSERILFMRDGRIVSDLKLPKYSGKNMDMRIEQISAVMRQVGI